MVVLTVSVGGVGWWGVGNIQQAFSTLQQQSLPEIARSLSLMEQSARLVAQAPFVANAKILFHLDEESRRLKEQLHAFEQQVTALRDTTVDTASMADLDALATRIEQALLDLVVVTRRGIFLDAEMRDRQYRLRQLYETIEQRITAARARFVARQSLDDATLLALMGETHRLAGILHAVATADSPASLQALETRYRQALHALRPILAGLSGEDDLIRSLGMLSALGSAEDNLFAARQRQFANEDHRAYLLTASNILSTELNDQVARLVDHSQRLTEQHNATAAAVLEDSRLRIVVLGLLGLLAALLSASYVIRDLGGTLGAVTWSMRQLIAGDRQIAVPGTGRRDEIGDLARAFEVFRQDLIQLDETSRQLTENNRQLEQARKMESVGQLTGGLAHDFSNLLSIIIGNLSPLQERLVDQPRLRDKVLRALEAADRGALITQRLLAFARKQSLKPQVVNVNELIEGMLDLIDYSVGDAVTVETRLEPAVWPVLIDPGQLENALMNLALNSRDAMPGGGRLTISTGNRTLTGSPTLAPGDYLVLSVRDSGSGIPPEVVDRVFEPFFTTKPVGTGSGLGLSMVYGFIRQSGGQVRIDSTPGAGTTIQLYLRRAESGNTGF